MNDRLVTFVCACGALALFLAMFLHGEDTGGSRDDISRPTTEERRANGYGGAMAWLDQEHIRTVSVRDRFNELAVSPTLPAGGNLLIVTLPAASSFKTEELHSLESWVRAGNTLLVLAALSDDPDWAFVLGRPLAGDLSLLTGLEFELARSRGRRRVSADEIGARIAATARAFAQPQHSVLLPNGPHPYFQGVRSAVALSDYPAQAWGVKIPYDGFVLSLAHEQAVNEGVFWLRSLGSGRIIVSGFGSLFTNRALGLADNGRLLANIVAATVGPHGAVLFDDMHQGLGAAYDPAKFYSDPRLYGTVGILAALWLCWVLGSTRLQMPVLQTSAPREAELVRVTGGFLARVLSPDAAARGLFEHFFRRIRQHLPAARQKSGPPWEALERLAGVSTGDVRQLQDWYSDACAARRVPLGRLHNLIVKIDRHLTA
ncbi:MAG TPA: DUF4350 domain-containing protein [Steroidobacteraceae bacterium]